jgi:hypothetical protein
MFKQLDNIKEKILKLNPYFNTGYGLFYIDQESGIILSYDKPEFSIHIQDNLQNYFFFVLDGQNAADNSDSLIYRMSTPVKLICVYRDINPVDLRNCILNSVTGILGVNLLTNDVIRNLMPEAEDETVLSVLKSLGRIRVSSFDIVIKESLIRNECVCKPCEDCGLQDG